jgi:hypothetical protein
LPSRSPTHALPRPAWVATHTGARSTTAGNCRCKVRVVSLAQLQREGGPEAVKVADMDIATRAQRLVDQLSETR